MRKCCNNRPTRDDGEGTRINRTEIRCVRGFEAICRGGGKAQPKGGNVANRLDDAEQYWRELAKKRQEAKMTLLTAHQAFLKEDAIQKEAMVYTKKALEAQEKVDATARLAQQREQAEADTLKEQEMSEQQAWHRLTSLRHQIVKYRTMTREQVEEMEREQRRWSEEWVKRKRLRMQREKSSVRGCRANDGRSGQSETTTRRAGENLKSSVVAHKKLEQNRLSQQATKNDDDDDAKTKRLTTIPMYTKKLSKSTKCGTHLRSVCSLSHSLLYHGTVVKSRRRIFKRLLFYIFIETTQHTNSFVSSSCGEISK